MNINMDRLIEIENTNDKETTEFWKTMKQNSWFRAAVSDTIQSLELSKTKEDPYLKLIKSKGGT